MNKVQSERSLYIYCPLGKIEGRTRLVKLVEVLKKTEVSFKFFTWKRTRVDRSSLKTKPIFFGGGYGGAWLKLLYPFWMFSVFVHGLLIGRRKVVYCLGFETAFPMIIASALTRSRVIFDDADRFSMIVKFPGPLRKLIETLERYTSKKSAVHIIPSKTRYDWDWPTMRVVRNSPLESDVERSVPRPRNFGNSSDEGPITILINGWLGKNRGVGVFLKCIEEINKSPCRDDFKFVVAGRYDSAIGEQLVKSRGVEYHGELAQREFFKLYESVSVVLTFYDPLITVNRYAEPNKWGDCVMFGVPFIANSEVETASSFISQGAAWSVPYEDYSALTNLLLSLNADRSRLAKASEQIFCMKDTYPFFDSVMKEVLDEIFN